MSEPSRKINVTERTEVPWLSVVLGYGPMLPLVAGAVGAWGLADPLRMIVSVSAVTYGASILAFLAGVRRGLSFRTEGGPQASQLASMLVLYLLAISALIATVTGALVAASLCLVIGFTVVAILDPIAAKHGTAPLFFMRLRPTQIPIAALSLAALCASLWIRG